MKPENQWRDEEYLSQYVNSLLFKSYICKGEIMFRYAFHSPFYSKGGKVHEMKTVQLVWDLICNKNTWRPNVN